MFIKDTKASSLDLDNGTQVVKVLVFKLRPRYETLSLGFDNKNPIEHQTLVSLIYDMLGCAGYKLGCTGYILGFKEYILAS